MNSINSYYGKTRDVANKKLECNVKFIAKKFLNLNRIFFHL